ncbi:DEAD/DEAH box helicase [Propionimicrobium sp. PCR01-08-3]|uniref:DEAD/DEAH box helicase n=1 Tax=Propionimicrobium sp. PCR01-08-3 TaxID=3052086 RepID=UPI00255CCB3D|nr:DEAD/DEAH box helicase [Propionimicrobium sp. PCR01-08-3]WIY82095.1 DEAD/DEAH box helicase [Propionimicrobium sp. PCR01-08-3]
MPVTVDRRSMAEASCEVEQIKARGNVEAVAVPGWLASDSRVVCVRHRDAVAGECADWPGWLPTAVRESVVAAGIERPWLHQVNAANRAWGGEHVAMSTATASGKSLAYLLPIMAATAVPPGQASLGFTGNDLRSRLGVARHTALYLAPTKALAHDQWAAARALGPKGWQVACLDGDSLPAERQFARDYASFVLSNPDMLHRSVLPNHANWSGFLGSLRYVVVDEAHRYRGVFGSQVSAVLRRLRRLCHAYGSDPVFILASATSNDPGRSGALLIGEDEPIAEVSEDFSPHAARDVVLWKPATDAPGEASELLAKLVDDGEQVITFVASRAQAELIALRAGKHIDSGRKVASYRSGYLAGDRRKLESDLRSGELAGVAATNALELGIDISGLDAVVMAGFPGTLGSFWQQSGRAGRGDKDALVVLLAKNDPLDEHLLDHPEFIFDGSVEQTVLHPQNPYVLGPQLAAAAQEAPLKSEDQRWFGPTMTSLASGLTDRGLLRARPTGWFWTKDYRAVDEIDLRGSNDRPVEIVEASSGRVLGSVDQSAADRTVYEGAVYLHQGEQWLVTKYLPGEKIALVKSVELPYYTQPLGISDVHIISTLDEYPCGRGIVCRGEVELSSQVTGYLRRDSVTSDVWDETPLELPRRQMTTQSMWWLIPDDAIGRLSFSAARLGSAVHAAEHTAIGLLPAFAPCDRWDIGGLSTALHPDTDMCTIFVHDGAPGGSGYAEHGFEVAESWWKAALNRLDSCSCETGCPSCCVSPKCGNGNRMLDKSSAAELLTVLLD